MRVVGTAGHVDHGKSTLVAALTGIHPDRLKEEQAREMTIELGFAWMTLPDGETVGIVDVPGHRDFIENMLAGVGGIDAVMFVVAADEGVMPQTREHLAILDILQTAGGVIVLTKIDLADEEDWLDLVEADVRAAVQGTVLADAPLVRVSSKTGKGLEELTQALMVCLAERPQRPDLGRARLPIDRVFTISGFGTVVTGTLTDGQLHLGDEVEILPSGAHARIRGLQTHKNKEDAAVPGSRTAVNLSGIDVGEIRRGDVLARPGRYQPALRLDAHFRLLPDASSPLQHSCEVKFFIGAAEMVARVRLLGVEELKPGEEGWVQLELRQPVVAVRGDHYILRRPSLGETLGGGVVVDPQPVGRYKRFDESVLKRLDALLQGTPAEILYQAAVSSGAATVKEIVNRSRLDAGQAQAALQELLESGQLVQLESGQAVPQADLYVMALPLWLSHSDKARQEVAQFHRAYPLRWGMPREELKSRLKLTGRVFNAATRLWVEAGSMVESKALVALPDHSISFNPQQQAQVQRLLGRFAAAPFGPPSVKESQAEVGEEVFATLVETGVLVQVSAEVVFREEDYRHMLKAVQEYFASHELLTAAQFRDQFQTSRKYALGFLEHLDGLGITVREGDARRLRKKPGA
jgi:selenocysteine-specific elongation factor